ncbi:MAG: putative protease [Candidatus Berkelbacteria bacterium Licking1014_7]|uniref:Putative protease n=1 Tax=Candidatus Berkelbacteria bacterium Licking1014_7 TaxID=2017147 RepID=A0A554LJP9_9BACT|nr:MAG: putative protease [Candidatus Berkelbacteria bacterium Licking1014_7]
MGIFILSLAIIANFNVANNSVLATVSDQVLTASAFSDVDTEDTHQASQWQVSQTTGNYTTTVFDSGTDTAHLTNITVSSALLAAETTYYWRVRYQDNHNSWSAWSSESSFTTGTSDIGDDGTDEVFPNCPENLSATAGDKQVVLSWKAPLSNNTNRYRIYRSETASQKGDAIATISDTGTTISYTDSQLKNTKTYYYTVTTYADSPGESPSCSQVSVTTLSGNPPSPTNVSVSVSGTKATITWINPSVSDFDHVLIYRALSEGDEGTIIYTSSDKSINSYIDAGLALNTIYYYKVVAVDTDGNQSEGSFVASDYTAKCPAHFNVVRIKNNGVIKGVYLNWDSAGSVVSYNIYKKVGSGESKLVKSLVRLELNYFDKETSLNKLEYELKVIFVGNTAENSCVTYELPEISGAGDDYLILSTVKFIKPFAISVAQAKNSAQKVIESVELKWEITLKENSPKIKSISLSRMNLNSTNNKAEKYYTVDPALTSFIDSDFNVETDGCEYWIWLNYDFSGDDLNKRYPIPSDTVADKISSNVLSYQCFNTIIAPQKNAEIFKGKKFNIAWTQVENDKQDNIGYFNLSIFSAGTQAELNLAEKLPYYINESNNYNNQSSDTGFVSIPPENYKFYYHNDPQGLYPVAQSYYVLNVNGIASDIPEGRADIIVSLYSQDKVLLCQQMVNVLIKPTASVIVATGNMVGKISSYMAAVGVVLAVLPTILSAMINGLGSSILAVGNVSLLERVGYIFATLPQRIGSFLYLPGRKKRHSWGVVLSSDSNEVMPRALIGLYDAEFGKKVKTMLTDAQGRFWFLISRQGNYYINIKKPGYKDYVSEPFEIKNITQLPVGQIIHLKGAKLNERKLAIGLMVVASNVIKYINLLRTPVLLIGSLAAIYNLLINPEFFQSALMGLYVLLWVFEIYLLWIPRPYGRVLSYGKPVPLTIVRATSDESDKKPIFKTAVTDKLGRFSFLLNPGTYQFKARKIGYQAKEISLKILRGQVAHPDLIIEKIVD